jgi:hypothetical protein
MTRRTVPSRWRIAAPAAAVAIGALLCCSSAVGAENIGFVLEPTVGGSWITIKALEIDKAFITAADEDEQTGDDWESVDPDAIQRSVGRKSYYEGSGFSLGGSLGLVLFNLTLGVAYAWDSVTLDGYSKKYRYEPDLMRAGGRKFWDTGVADLHRVMARVSYSLPIARFRIKFQTRIGALYMDEGPLIVGRAIGDSSGFAGDVGLGLSFMAFPFLSVGIDGCFGFFSFSGAYEGAYGTMSGIYGTIGFHI